MVQLIGKKAKVQLMEDGILPDHILYVIENWEKHYRRMRNLDIVGLLNKELTIEKVTNEFSKFEQKESEYFYFLETKLAGYPPVSFPSKYFQLAIHNHPLTNIFQD